MSTERPSYRASDSQFVSIELIGGEGNRARTLLVSRFPVSVREYAEFIAADGYLERRWWSARGWAWNEVHEIKAPTYWGRNYTDPDMPVTGVSFWEAEAYATFRDAVLPTEYEWYLFASNGGASRYPWGRDGEPPTEQHANLRFVDEFGLPTRVVPVNSTVSSGSGAGVRDLIGNVAEWCLPFDSLELRADALAGVLRGGASWHAPGAADVSFRDVVSLSVRDNQTGIRLVRRPDPKAVTTVKPGIGWPNIPRPLGRALKRPTTPFRQEGIPSHETLSEWRLKVRGVPNPREFTLEDLRKDLPTKITPDSVFVCVCRWGAVNQVAGVPLVEVLEKCGLRSFDIGDRHFLKQRSMKGPTGEVYETTVPLAEAIEHQALLVYAMDGKELTEELGYPLRYIDFHMYGYKNVKCLSELVITDSYSRGWWEEKCHYDIDGTILPGTVMIVGPDAMRVDIPRRGRVDMSVMRKGGRK